MEEDLFNGGNNPCYESFQRHDAAITKMTLDKMKVPFKVVDNLEIHTGIRSVKFFVKKKDSNFNQKKEEVELTYESNPALLAQFKHECSQFYLP